MEILLRRCDNSGGQLEGKPLMMNTSSLTYPSADFTREKNPDRRQTTLENTDFWVIFKNIKLKMFPSKTLDLLTSLFYSPFAQNKRPCLVQAGGSIGSQSS